MDSYRLNKTAFKAQTATAASDHATYYKKLTWLERLRITNYVNNIAYNYPESEPPKDYKFC